jgi:putative phosphoesterase
MKLAVLSDIHANYIALEAVTDHIERWGPDFVVVAGDMVNRGPRSGDCLQFLLEKQKTAGWEILRGNHEDYVIFCAEADNLTPAHYSLFQPVFFAIDQLDRNVSVLKNLPETITKNHPDYGQVRVVHASMKNNRDGVYPETPDRSLRKKIAPAPAVFVTGHTHRPLTRTLNGTLVINSGSAGLPFDEDVRPSYAQITWRKGQWQAEIVRVKYDIIQAEKDYATSGYLENAGPISQLVRLELKSGLGQLYQWTSEYNDPILKGETTVEAAVKDFLQSPITKPYW